MSNTMCWVDYDGDSQKLRDLPHGTILLVREVIDDYNAIKVLGDGKILSCDFDHDWMFYDGVFTYPDRGYKILKYAVPPEEYQDFLNFSVDELNTKN